MDPISNPANTGLIEGLSNGLGILLARPASSQGAGYTPTNRKRPTGAEASPVERRSRGCLL